VANGKTSKQVAKEVAKGKMNKRVARRWQKGFMTVSPSQEANSESLGEERN
jgi:hypothetical protein